MNLPSLGRAGTPSLRLDAGSLDYRPPFLDLGFLVSAERLRRLPLAPWKAIQDSPELRKRFAFEGVDVLQMSVAEFGAFMASEHAKWGRVISDAKIKAE